MSKFGRKRYRSHDSRGVLPGKRSIAERPVEVERRQKIGHWEGDTFMGSDLRHCVLTLVERKTDFAIIKKLSARNKQAVTRAATRAIRRHCRNFKTLTLDKGTEFHDYASLEQRFPVTVYFATPYHSWERASNENLNGLVRQYLPKGTCMRNVSQARCDQIADDLNNRPRSGSALTHQQRYTFETKPCCTYSLNLRPGFAKEGKALGMRNRLDSKIDIEVRPVQVMRCRHRDVQQLANGRFAKPREISKRQEIFGLIQQQPEPVSGYVGNLNGRSGRSRRGG